MVSLFMFNFHSYEENYPYFEPATSFSMSHCSNMHHQRSFFVPLWNLEMFPRIYAYMFVRFNDISILAIGVFPFLRFVILKTNLVSGRHQEWALLLKHHPLKTYLIS